MRPDAARCAKIFLPSTDLTGNTIVSLITVTEILRIPDLRDGRVAATLYRIWGVWNAITSPKGPTARLEKRILRPLPPSKFLWVRRFTDLPCRLLDRSFSNVI